MSNVIKNATLCFLLKRENGKITKICLAMKKRGFGKGRWNGVGGKVDGDETIESATERETFEEIGVKPLNLEKVATLTFLFPDNPDWNQVVHAFITYDWTGEPTESEEMQPQWFDIEDIPFELMWADDEKWLPQILLGNKVLGTFTFGKEDLILSHTINLVKADEL